VGPEGHRPIGVKRASCSPTPRFRVGLRLTDQVALAHEHPVRVLPERLAFAPERA
jgi:hypothetical protein